MTSTDGPRGSSTRTPGWWRTPAGRGGDPLALATAQLVAATGFGAVAVPVAGPATGSVGVSGVVAVVMLGIFATGFTFALTNRLIADEGATTAATVGYLVPVVSVALGALVLDEELGARVVAGMAVVLVGVALTRSKAPAVRPGRTTWRRDVARGPVR
ncbi:EamA family transporter [Streptomyces sp. NPDC002867]